MTVTLAIGCVVSVSIEVTGVTGMQGLSSNAMTFRVAPSPNDGSFALYADGLEGALPSLRSPIPRGGSSISVPCPLLAVNFAELSSLNFLPGCTWSG